MRNASFSRTCRSEEPGGAAWGDRGAFCECSVPHSQAISSRHIPQWDMSCVCKGHMCRDVWLHCSRNGCLKVAKGTVAGARGHEGEAARCCVAGAVGELGRDGMGEG